MQKRLKNLRVLCVLRGSILLTVKIAEPAKAKKEGVAEKQTADTKQQPLRLRETENVTVAYKHLIKPEKA